MPSDFYAVTPIRHGVSNDAGEQTDVKEFGVGDKVTGLSKEDMKALWDAGALEQREVTAKPSASVESSPKVDATGAGAKSKDEESTPPTE